MKEIIFCKECIYAKPDLFVEKFWCNIPTRIPFLAEPNDYCSKAVREEKKEND